MLAKELPKIGRLTRRRFGLLRQAHHPHAVVVAVAEVSTSADLFRRRLACSVPDGADIEIDGSFVGNTPSAVEAAPGDHVVIVTKSGYKPWERKLKVGGGEIKLTAELEK